jgi:hypothetical protein
MGQRTHESADADDGDLLAGPGAATDKARVGGETGAEHRRGRLGRERVRDRKDVELVGDNPGRVPALGRDAVEDGVGASEEPGRSGAGELDERSKG